MKLTIPLLLLVISMIACKSSTPKEAVVKEAPTATGLADSLHGKFDSTVVAPVVEDKTSIEEAQAKVTDHICNPNLTLLAKPAKNQLVYYVTGFNPLEFRCWEILETHGIKESQNMPIVIYYLDNANVTFSSSPPHYIDLTTLKAHGIGKFEYDGKFWEITGSSRWKRKDKGYEYYNTNNQLGG